MWWASLVFDGVPRRPIYVCGLARPVLALCALLALRGMHIAARPSRSRTLPQRPAGCLRGAQQRLRFGTEDYIATCEPVRGRCEMHLLLEVYRMHSGDVMKCTTCQCQATRTPPCKLFTCTYKRAMEYAMCTVHTPYNTVPGRAFWLSCHLRSMASAARPQSTAWRRAQPSAT